MKERRKKKYPELLIWKNGGGVEWRLEKVNSTTFKCIGSPYPNTEFNFKLNENNTVKSFFFQNDEYILISETEKISTETVNFIGNYNRKPIENYYHIGTISCYEGFIDIKLFFFEKIQKSYAWSLLKPMGYNDEEIHNLQKQIITLETFFKLEKMLKNQEYEAGYELVTDYFGDFENKPPYLDREKGANFGTPVCLYALLMLRRIFEYHHNKKAIRTSEYLSNAKTIPYIITVAIAGKSHGTWAESIEAIPDESKRGEVINHKIHPDILKDDFKIIRESLFIFSNYINAISKGILQVQIEFVYLDSIDVLCEMSKSENGVYLSTIKNHQVITDEIPKELYENSSMILNIYPSHRPYMNKELSKIGYISGGIFCNYKPNMIADDILWIIKIGEGFGPYTDEERRAYIPQWLKHEYYHYLFKVAFKEYNLEVDDHDWFDWSNWPSDFVGRTEPEYYDQALVKRFFTCDTPLAIKLTGKLGKINSLDINALLGNYERVPGCNEWHYITITKDQINERFKWTNKANISWDLKLDLENA